MMWRDVITLEDVSIAQSEIGDQVESVTTTNVFANKKGVRQSEFYQAYANGLKPELMFEVRSFDYAEQTYLSYQGKRYLVIRTYSKNDEITELVCTGIVVKGSV